MQKPVKKTVRKTAKTAPGEAYRKVLDSISGDISVYDGPDVFLDEFNQVGPKLGHLFAADFCFSEICNGGLYQFFWNSSGVLAPEAHAGFIALGLPKTAKLLAKAMKFFGPEYPRDRAERQALLPDGPEETQEEWNPFDKMDTLYFKLYDQENGGFEKAADAYARRIRQK